jgi:hypothetical protein
MGPSDFYLSYMDIKLPAQCLIDRPGACNKKKKLHLTRKKAYEWKALGKKLDLPPIYS